MLIKTFLQYFFMKKFFKNFLIIFLGVVIAAGNAVPVLAVVQSAPNYALADVVLTSDGLSYTIQNTESGSKIQIKPLVIWYTWYDESGAPVGTLQKEVTPPGSGGLPFISVSVPPGQGNDVSDFLFSADHTDDSLQIWLNPETSIPEKNYKDNQAFLSVSSGSGSEEAIKTSGEESLEGIVEDAVSSENQSLAPAEQAASLELPDISIIGLIMEEDGVTVVVKNDGTVSTVDSVSAVIQWVKDGAPVGTNAIKINLGPIGPGEEVTKKLDAGGITQVGQFLGTPPVPGAMIQVIADPEDVVKESDDTGNNIKMVVPISQETDGAELVDIKSDAQEVLPGYDPVVLPGSPLYVFKQFIQKVQELLAFSDEAKAELAVHTAAKKAKELQVLLEKGDEESFSTALELYTEEITEAAELLDTLDPEDPETQEIAETAFEEGLRTQILLGEVMDELSGEDLAAAAEAQETGMEATADALEVMDDPEAQKESIEEVFEDSGDPLDALGNAAILEDLADHIGDEDEDEEFGEEQIGEEADEFEIGEEEVSGEEVFEAEVVEDESFENEFGFEDAEEQGFESEEDLLVSEEESSPLELLLAGITEDFVGEAATQIEILAEDNPDLVSDYVAEMTDASASDIISVLDNVAQEAPTPEVLDIVEESTKKIVEKVSEQIANAEAPEETAEILLPVEKKDPIKRMRVLQKVSEQAVAPQVVTHVEASFDKAVNDFAKNLEQQTARRRAALIKQIASEASDLTQVVVLNKVSERLATVPTERPAELRTAIATLQEKVIDQIQENIATAPNEEARRRAFSAAVGSGSSNIAEAERLQERLGVHSKEILSAREERVAAQERRAAFEQGIAPPERTAPVQTPKEEPATETEVIESRPVETKTNEQQEREEALRRKEAADKKTEDDRLEKARRAELQKQRDDAKLTEDAAEKLETAPAPRPSAGEAEKIERQAAPEKSVTTPRTTTTTQPKTRVTPTTPSSPESTDVSPTRRTTATTTRPAVRQRPSQTTTSTTRQESPASQTPAQRGVTPQPTTRTTEPAPSQPTTRTTEPAPAPAPTRTSEPAPAPTTETRTRTQSVSLDNLFNDFISEVGNSVTVVKNLLSFSVFAATGFFLR